MSVVQRWERRCALAVGRPSSWQGLAEFVVSDGDGAVEVSVSADAGVIDAASTREPTAADTGLARLWEPAPLRCNLGGEQRDVMLVTSSDSWSVDPPLSFARRQQIAPADLALTMHATLTSSPLGREHLSSVVVEAGQLVSLGQPVGEPDVRIIVDYGVWWSALSGERDYASITSAEHMEGRLWALSHLVSVVSSPQLHAILAPFRPAARVLSVAGHLVAAGREGQSQ